MSVGGGTGIGYPPDSCFAQFKVYESYAVMHNHYGIKKVVHPPWYDCVIPNYFDPDQFDFKVEKGNYFLYLGRITRSKGVDVILHLAKKMGFRLLVSGQGSLETELGEVHPPANVQYVGFADLGATQDIDGQCPGAVDFDLLYRAVWWGGGGGDDVGHTGDHLRLGVFNETVLHGITGYRCRTIDHFEWAIRNIDRIDPPQLPTVCH